MATNNVPVLGAEAANTPQPADDVTITAQTSQFTITATVDQILTRYSLWFAAATPDVQIRGYDGPNNTDPIASTVTDLENHASLPQYGLFTTKYTHETIVNLATQLTVLDDTGAVQSVGAVLRDLLARVTALEP